MVKTPLFLHFCYDAKNKKSGHQLINNLLSCKVTITEYFFLDLVVFMHGFNLILNSPIQWLTLACTSVSSVRAKAWAQMAFRPALCEVGGMGLNLSCTKMYSQQVTHV